MLEAQSREYNEMTSQTQTAKEKANSQDGGRLAFVASVVLLKTPFTADEIDKASKSMKNRKSVGEDGLNAEYVKYGPP